MMAELAIDQSGNGLELIAVVPASGHGVDEFMNDDVFQKGRVSGFCGGLFWRPRCGRNSRFECTAPALG